MFVGQCLPEHCLPEPGRGFRSRVEGRPEQAAGPGSHEMTQYLISFDEGAMTFPAEELADVAEAGHAVIQAANDAGVFVFSGGLKSHEEVSVVGTDGTITDGPYPQCKAYVGGFTVLDVPSREDALEWAAKIAVACRCAQEVREFVYDPTV
jgi:hypothetical protein